MAVKSLLDKARDLLSKAYSLLKRAMSKVYSLLTRASALLDRCCGTLIVAMLAAMVVITTLQIVCRLWFTALTWSDEVTRYLLIWSTFLGATCVYKHGGNISITFVQEKAPKPVGRALRTLSHAVCFLLFAVLLHFGVQYCTRLTKTATSLRIQMKYIYACVPLSMGIMMLHALVMGVDACLNDPRQEVKA